MGSCRVNPSLEGDKLSQMMCSCTSLLINLHWLFFQQRNDQNWMNVGLFFLTRKEKNREDNSREQQLSSHLLSNLNPLPPPVESQPTTLWKAFLLFTYENTQPTSYHRCQAWNAERDACDHLQVFLAFLILYSQLQSFCQQDCVFPPPHICLKIPIPSYVQFKLIYVERFRANVVCRWGCYAHWQSQMVSDCGQTRSLDNVQSLARGSSSA